MNENREQAMTHDLLAGGSTPSVDSPAGQALAQLLDGNRRFVAGTMEHPHQDDARRGETARGQRPVAAVLGCADSRVPPEIVFDQGLGDLFTVRVAGNIVEDSIADSLAFAVEQLGVRLIVVLGHQNCGAVQATLDALGGAQNPAHHPSSLVRAIGPVARNIAERGGDVLKSTIRANVLHTVATLSAIEPFAQHIEDDELHITGAYYSLDTGEVEFLS